ncbi:MAG: YfcE family phosphodiesterase [Candidatus Merdivicinus sp.]
MRIIVISDTHRDFHTLWEIVQKHRKEADLFLHLGDGERELDDLLAVDPDLPLQGVRGNCDFASLRPATEVAFAGDVKIFLCHGHTLYVNAGLDHLVSQARANGCRIALYGHTHRGDVHYEDGIYVMNPGSPSQPRDGKASYGIIDITDGGILPFLVEI